jgi:hypothetical protein
MRCVLPLLALGFRLRTRTSVTPAEPVEMLTVEATVEYVDYASMSKHADLVELTKSSVANFIQATACNNTVAADSAFLQIGKALRRGNASNGTNESAPESAPGEAAEEPADGSDCGKAVVRFFGNPFHISAEMPSDPDAKAALEDPGFPKLLSDFLLTVPGVLLYASAPPICEFATVATKNVTSVIPGCEEHLPKLLSEMRHAYTNRMVPWAINAACGAFATTLSFASSSTPNEADRVFCETASKHLMHTHYDGVTFQHEEGRPTGKEYQDWCVEVCEYRHGPTQVCSRGANATEAGNATDAGGNATDAGGNATDANATALVHRISDAGLFRRLRMVRKH